MISCVCSAKQTFQTYAAKLITLHIGLSLTSKSTLVYQVRQFLFHEFLNLRNGLFKAFAGCTRDVEIQRGILQAQHQRWRINSVGRRSLTDGVANDLSG